MFPDFPGPGKYLPMLRGLFQKNLKQLEKRLLEIHRQFIAGSGLIQCLDQVKDSITGAGNVVVKVSQITSTRYMLHVCLCAEYKVMRVVFDSFESTDDIQDQMEKKLPESPVFHYWKMIFALQILF